MEHFDVVVAGGGPGGSTVAALVAKAGHRVLLLERERFPRYQIGESLLPATVHGICTLLGVRDAINAAGFTRKRGGTFRWGKRDEPWSFAFTNSSALNTEVGYAYQVERSRFDAILLDNAARLGVDVRQEHSVVDFVRDQDRIVGVRYLDASGHQREARAQYVVDASGNQTRLAAQIGSRTYSKFFRNVALFCYFENGRRLPPPNEGNILSVAFRHGWFWYIPLTPTLTSVGAVVAHDEAARVQAGHERAMRGFIAECPLIAEYLSHATRVTDGPYGRFRVRTDYSYCLSTFWQPGAMTVGDAACFVDPVFSSGVHLATYAGLQAARAINSCLRGDVDEARGFAEFERRYRREFGHFYEFLMAFYDMNQDESSYFWSARKVIQSDESEQEAFLRLVAGIASSDESVLAAVNDYSAQPWRRSMPPVSHAATRRADTPVGRELMTVLRHETGWVRALGLEHHADLPERPLFEGGLQASADGLHWAEPAYVGSEATRADGPRPASIE
jgi:halogenation protein CepH